MKTKIKICLNVLLHYSKYKKLLGLPVKVIKNNGLPKYDKLVGKFGYVLDFEFYNFEKPCVVVIDKQKYCFGFDEIDKNIFSFLESSENNE